MMVFPIAPLSQVEQPLSVVLLPPSLTYLPAAQADHVEHAPWLDEDVYLPEKNKSKVTLA